MTVQKISVTFCLLVCVIFTVAQQTPVYSNLRQKKIVITDTLIKLDTLSIVPGTLAIKNIPDSLYSVDYASATLKWLSALMFDSVMVSYRVFPFNLSILTKRFDLDSIVKFSYTPPIFLNPYTNRGDKVFDFGNINYNGSFGRGISFGNNQDPVLNSSLNLQINGLIGDSMELAAAITDNNIPIQPDGNTQQLNEFDKVLIQLKRKKWQLNLGDIDLRQDNSYFLNFYKRLQGISFQNEVPVFAKGSNKSVISGAIAKGKFTRNIFQGLEGNQGPY
ncbi:MAG TPA: hypothetical protein VFN30_09830, partial [Chitinophagaceae bacterium]|nr:hypothetical protein [Chitinophagaceae bacterium]